LLKRIGLILATLVAYLPVLYAHILISRTGYAYAGLLAPLDRVFDLSFAIFLLGSAFFVGRAISRRLSLNFANISEEISVSIMVGTGTLALGVLGLGLVGLLRPMPMLALLGLIIAVCHNEGATLVEVAKQGVRSITATRERRLITLVLAVLATFLVFRALIPPRLGDEVIYHLAVPKRFVELGRIFPVYDNSLGNMPFLIHMIYAVCLLVKADIAARLFSLFLAFTTALALYGFCARFLTTRIGIVALLIFFAAGMVIEVAVTTRIDVSLAGTLFLAVYTMMVYLDTGQKGWLYTSAMLSGFALGIKLTAGLWLALIGVMYLAESLQKKREPFAEMVKHSLIYIGVAAMIASPWYVKNWVWFDNPVYPFITGEVAEYGAKGIRYFTAEDERRLDAHFENARREIPSIVESQEHTLAEAAALRPKRHPLHPWEYFTKPDTYNMAEHLHWPNYIFLVAPLFLALAFHRWVTWLVFFAVAFYLVSASSTWIGRYLLPIYPPLTIISAYTLVGLADFLRSRIPIVAERLAGYAIGIAAGMTLSICLSLCTALLYHSSNLSFISGAISRNDFLSARDFQNYPLINRNLPSNARLMMVGVQESYNFERDYLADPSWYATEWRRVLVHNATLDAVHQELKRKGITHIVYDPSLFKFAAYSGLEGTGGMDAMYPSWLRGNGPDYKIQLRNWATFELYSRKYLAPIYSGENGFTIYELK
jgi:4-amino-4-deoxy-L-arabinose transferase-like glycosyltransferase